MSWQHSRNKTYAFYCEGQDAGLNDDHELFRYVSMRRSGESHNMAMVLASRKFPGFVTDDIFLKGNKTGEQFAGCPELGAYYRSVAEGEGVSTNGKTYLSGIAAYPGDPRAWVSGRSDVLAVARERNYNVEGLVQHTGHAVEPTADIPIARDILVREAARFRADGMKMDEAMAKAYDLRTGSHDIGQPQLVDDDVPHPAEVLANES